MTPGEYKGKATLTPSIGDPIEVELKATVIASENQSREITLSTYTVDFGRVSRSSSSNLSKNNNQKEVVVTLTNNSDETLTSLSAQASFPGSISVKISFSPLAPGESMQIPFVFSPGSTEPGDYTGSATITPSIGDPIEVELKATVI